jgi:hypothetical protein
MSSYIWLRPFARRLLGHRGRNASSTRLAASSRRRVRPCLEALEDRITPTLYQPLASAADGTVNSLRADISLANQDSGTDTIQLQAGTYTLTQLNTAGHDVQNNSGDLNILTSHPLVIQGTTDASGKPATTIQQTVADRVFQIVNAGTNVIFRNLIIEGGQAQEDGGPGRAAGLANADGGGILDDGGNVTLSNVVLQSNKAIAGTGFNANGGGIYVSKAGSLTIQSSVIQANQALGNPTDAPGSGGNAAGGGVYTSGKTTIGNSTLSNNVVTGQNSSGDGLGGSASGGGIWAAGSTNITASTISGNKVTGGTGQGNIGGDAQGGGVIAYNQITIANCIVSGNTLTGGNGSVTNNPNLAGGRIAGDIGGSAEGGGLYVHNFTVEGSNTTTIIASSLTGNTLTGGMGTFKQNNVLVLGDVGGEVSGGGVFQSLGEVNISTSNLSNNTLTGGRGNETGTGSATGSIGGSASGGGLFVIGGSATLADLTLSGNTVTGGSGTAFGGSGTPGTAQGGGACFQTSINGGSSRVGSFTTLTNATVAGNQVIGGQGFFVNPDASGGGLFFGEQSAEGRTNATLTNVTVADNKASPAASGGGTSGGGIDSDNGDVTLVNTLVALNSVEGANSSGPDYNGFVQNSDHNLIGNPDGSTGIHGSTGFSATRGDLLGTSANPLNPQLGSLANYGGLTPTLELLPGSPAIDAGDTSALSVTGPFDQRGQGFERVVGVAIDIGAFEVQPPPPPPLVIKPPPPPSPAPPPTLHTPSLLSFFDSLLAAVETMNSDGTETVTDSLFGFPLIVSTYDGAGDLLSVTLFGMNVTSLFESL